MVPPIQFTEPSKKLDPKPNKYCLRPHASLTQAHRVAVALSAAVLLAAAQSGSAQCPHCTATPPVPFPVNTPLNDLGPGTYLNPSPSPGTTPVQGGLYPGGFNQRPNAHEQAGLDLANQIVPIDGKIQMISIGMCNTTMEFGGALGIGRANGFQDRVMDPQNLGIAPWRNPSLFVIDCAQSGQDAASWAGFVPPNGPWQALIDRGVGTAFPMTQVQVVWLKEALKDPEVTYGVWPTHAKQLQVYLETILGILNDPRYFGNVKMVFLSPRTRAWTRSCPNFTHSPEPDAYETGFADKWVIEDQLNGTISSTPWLSWGPYLWTDGDTPRSDGLTWPCSYVQQDDYVHPVVAGVTKVVDQLLAFFKTDPVATPWFLKTPDNLAPTITVRPTSATIHVGDSVQFKASATPAPGRTIKEFVWTFDDGDYAATSNALKYFKAPSRTIGAVNYPYQVHLTVIDSEGDAAFATVPVTVNPVHPRHGSPDDAKHRADTLPQRQKEPVRKIATTISKERGR